MNRFHKGFLFFVNLFCNLGLHANPLDLQELCGWHNRFLKEKNYLSPFNGFVWSETRFLEKMYRFGNVQLQEKNRVVGQGSYNVAQSGDATILLIHELFHDIAGTLHPVEEKTHGAAHFTPKLIGRLFNGIDHPQLLIQYALEQVRCDKNNAFKNERSRIIGLFKKFKGKNDNKKFQAIIQSVEDYNALLENSIAVLVKKSLRKKLLEQKPSVRKEVLTSCSKFAHLFVAALQEAGYFSDEMAYYLPYTPHFILLTFMYQKASTAHAFDSYVQEFYPPIVCKSSENIVEQKAYNFHQNPDILDKNFLEMKTDAEKYEFISEHFEEISLTEIFNQFHKKSIPQLHVKAKLVCPNGFEVIDCAELALYNFFLLIFVKIGAYNPQHECYNVDGIPQALYTWLTNKNINVDLKKIKERLSPILEHFNQFNTPEARESKDGRQKWAELLSNLHGVRYSSCGLKNDVNRAFKRNYDHPYIYPLQGVGYPDNYKLCEDDGNKYLYEIAGYADNFVAITRIFLGIECENFKALCELFDLELKEGLYENLTDEYLHQIKKQVACRFRTLIDKKPVDIIIKISRGHSEVVDVNAPVKRFQTQVMNFAVEHFADHHSFRNVSTLYSQFDGMKYLSPQNGLLSVKHYNHAWFMNNLFEKDGFFHALCLFTSESIDQHLLQFIQKQLDLFLNQTDADVFGLFKVMCENAYASKHSFEFVKRLYEIIQDRKLDQSNQSAELLLSFFIRCYSKYFELKEDLRNAFHHCIKQSRKDASDKSVIKSTLVILQNFLLTNILTKDQATQRIEWILKNAVSDFYSGLFYTCSYQVSLKESIYFYTHFELEIKNVLQNMKQGSLSSFDRVQKLFCEILLSIDSCFGLSQSDINCYVNLARDIYFSEKLSVCEFEALDQILSASFIDQSVKDRISIC